MAAAGVLGYRIRAGVETDLLKLADSQASGEMSRLAAGAARQGRILIEGPAGTELAPYIEKTLTALAQPPAGSFKATLGALASQASGLISARAREQLLAGEYKAVADEALSRLFGPVPPLFSVKTDPWLLATDYVLSLSTRLAPGWTLKDGYPTRESNGRAYAFLTVDLGAVAPGRIAGFIKYASSLPPPVKIWCGGPAFHTAVTAERAKQEINCLSVLSLVAVLAIGFWLFRSFGFVPSLLCALGFSALLASAALWTVFPRPHVLTFVFGTSLIGLAVDYVYHARAAGGSRNIRRPLTLAMLTTVCAFIPLLFAPMGVLKQMALFTVTGLLAAWGWVLATGGELTKRPATDVAKAWPRWGARLRWLLAGGILAISTFGWSRIRLVSDPTAFYRPPAYLAESERLLARLCPAQAQRWVYVQGDTLQEALEREEAAGVAGLSAIIPSLKRQRENHALVQKLAEAEGRDYTRKTGLKVELAESPVWLDLEKVTDARLQGLVKAMWVAGGLVSPCPLDFPTTSPHVTVLEPKRALTEMFASLTAETCRLLWWSIGCLALLLAVCFRRRFLAHALPLALALAATVGTLGLLGIDFTGFTLLAFLGLTGLGIDYVIFHQSGASPETGRTVFGSFLTSFIGLGALAFTSFAVTAAMGMVFAVGLFYVWLFARAWAPGTAAPARPEATSWHEQSEQSAGAWRLAFMWWVYRHLGKDALKIVCVPVMLFIYPFARPARRALAEFQAVFREYARLRGKGAELPGKFMHLLSFAWALVDKTDVCTLRRSPPRVVVREDDAFRSLTHLIAAGKGAFFISSHLGTVEVLPAIADSPAVAGWRRPYLHAFQSLGHNAEFTRRFLQNFGEAGFELHAVETIGVETAAQMQEAVLRGEFVLMAGDRTSAGSGKKVLEHDFLARPCVWPKGVFAFALLLECPIFFVTCVHVSRNCYEARFVEWQPPASGMAKSQRLSALLDAYVKNLETETCRFPGQWYQFYPFFSASKGGAS